MNVQNLLYNIVENSISVAALEVLNVNKMIPLSDSSKVGRYLKFGVIWTLADELILMLRAGTSHISEGNYYFLMDQVFMNSVLYATISESGIDVMVLDGVENIPLPPQYHGTVASGILKVAVKTVAEIIQTQYGNTPLGYITNPTMLIR